jgi:hypothetical protein
MAFEGIVMGYNEYSNAYIGCFDLIEIEIYL